MLFLFMLEVRDGRGRETLIGREVFKKDMLMLGFMMATRLGFGPIGEKLS